MTTKLAIQVPNTAVPIAKPRRRSGKISESISQNTVAMQPCMNSRKVSMDANTR